MTVDASRIKPGDEVTIRVAVKEVGRLGPSPVFWCRSEGVAGANGVYIKVENPDAVVEHHPAPPPPPKAGDRARYGSSTDGEVLAVHGDEAWFKGDNWVSPSTVSRRYLTKVEP